MSPSRRLRAMLFLSSVSMLFGASCGGARPKYEATENQAGTTSAGGSVGSAGGDTQSGGTQAGTEQSGGSVGSTTVPTYAGSAGTLVEITPAFDWNGVIGTGQSLSVGNVPITSTTQPYNNLMLSLGDATVPPWDTSVAGLSMAPLIEVSNFVGFPSPYPLNRGGETPQSAMANQLTTLVRYNSGSDFISVHSVVGESGQGMVALKKQASDFDTTASIGRAYAASLFEVGAIARLAKDANKTYGVGAIVMTHGETDSGSSTYESELIQLLSDYNTDLSALTGQTTKIPMLLSQQFAYPNTAGGRPVATLVQWRLGVDHPEDFFCTGPKYQYPGKGDGIHLSATGYQLLGEKTAQVYYERIVLKNDWRPLQPEGVTHDGRVVTVTFHVPVAPLVWDETLPDPTIWPTGKGFELRHLNSKINISSVEIDGNTVKITAATDLPEADVIVGYAMTCGGVQMENASRTCRWGKLRDSDPYLGSTTGMVQPNYGVAFELPVP